MIGFLDLLQRGPSIAALCWEGDVPFYWAIKHRLGTLLSVLPLWIHIPSQKVVGPSQAYINRLQSPSEKVCGSIGFNGMSRRNRLGLPSATDGL